MRDGLHLGSKKNPRREKARSEGRENVGGLSRYERRERFEMEEGREVFLVWLLVLGVCEFKFESGVTWGWAPARYKSKLDLCVRSKINRKSY